MREVPCLLVEEVLVLVKVAGSDDTPHTHLGWNPVGSGSCGHFFLSCHPSLSFFLGVALSSWMGKLLQEDGSGVSR